jgi:hypothetical protein
MKLSVRARTGIRRACRLMWVAVVAWVLGGCATETSLSRDAFVATYGCPKNQVAVSGNGDSVPIEAAGCGHSAQYSGCFTSTGCVSVQDLAVSEASTAWSCPKQRIEIGPTRAPDPPPPPTDVAADPARLTIWKGQHDGPVTHRTLSAAGCDHKGDVTCDYGVVPGVPGVTNNTGVWACSVSPPNSPASVALDTIVKAQLQGLATGSAVVKPEMLEGLATQMDASGQTAVAQALRAKAQQLRTAAGAPQDDSVNRISTTVH